jgi:MFS family permease
VSRATHYKPLTLWMTIHERVPFLGLALIAFLAPQASKLTILLLTFLMLVWQGIGAGLAANPWTSLVSKVIPGELHGTFFGAQAAAFNGFAGVSALATGLILGKVAPPLDFSLCFVLTFFCMVISFGFLAATREAESPPPGEEHTESLWAKALDILRGNPNFRAFIAVRILSQFAGMGFAFYVIYAVRQYGMSDAAAAILVTILLMGQVVLSPLMGRLGDQWSHRGIMSAGAVGAALSAILAWKATSPAWFYTIFLLEAVAIVAIWTIPLALSVSFATKESERPLYIGLANTLPAPAAILAPVIGGWIADTAGFGSMFAIAAICGMLMAGLLWFVVKDPAETRKSATLSRK